MGKERRRRRKILHSLRRGYTPKLDDSNLMELIKEGEVNLNLTLKGLKKALEEGL